MISVNTTQCFLDISVRTSGPGTSTEDVPLKARTIRAYVPERFANWSYRQSEQGIHVINH